MTSSFLNFNKNRPAIRKQNQILKIFTHWIQADSTSICNVVFVVFVSTYNLKVNQ